jgi:hypothetical protein
MAVQLYGIEINAKILTVPDKEFVMDKNTVTLYICVPIQLLHCLVHIVK